MAKIEAVTPGYQLTSYTVDVDGWEVEIVRVNASGSMAVTTVRRISQRTGVPQGCRRGERRRAIEQAAKAAVRAA